MTRRGPGPEYILARRVLLDALEALSPHRDALVLVGAQAVYLHAGDGDLVVAPTTSDADLALAPGRLRDEPLLADALRDAGFTPGPDPGCWRGTGGVAVDLMVPEALSGAGGRRGARLPVHGSQVARRTCGLEATLIDNAPWDLAALDPADRRTVSMKVAGPAALLVAKVIKVEDRRRQPHRLRTKDGLDVLRLLQAVDGSTLAGRLTELTGDPVAGPVTVRAIGALREHGSDPVGPLATLAAQAVGPLADPDTVIDSLVALVDDVLAKLPPIGRQLR